MKTVKVNLLDFILVKILVLARIMRMEIQKVRRINIIDIKSYLNKGFSIEEESKGWWIYKIKINDSSIIDRIGGIHR